VSSTLTASNANATLTGTPSVASVADSSTAQITYAAGSFTFTWTSTPVASYTPTFTLTVTLADSTENATSGNTTITQQTTLNVTPIAFNSGGGTFNYGRLQMRPTVGDYRGNLVVPLEVQTYTGTGWTTLTSSASCLVIPATAFAYSNPTNVLASGSNFTCATYISASVTPVNGNASLSFARPALPASTQPVPSAMTLTIDVLSPATGNSCNGSGTTAATTLAMPWLTGPAGTNPAARITWGRNRPGQISSREMFN
jgi:hypothetical protein